MATRGLGQTITTLESLKNEISQAGDKIVDQHRSLERGKRAVRAEHHDLMDEEAAPKIEAAEDAALEVAERVIRDAQAAARLAASAPPMLTDAQLAEVQTYSAIVSWDADILTDAQLIDRLHYFVSTNDLAKAYTLSVYSRKRIQSRRDQPTDGWKETGSRSRRAELEAACRAVESKLSSRDAKRVHELSADLIKSAWKLKHRAESRRKELESNERARAAGLVEWGVMGTGPEPTERIYHPAPVQGDVSWPE